MNFLNSKYKVSPTLRKLCWSNWRRIFILFRECKICYLLLLDLNITIYCNTNCLSFSDEFSWGWRHPHRKEISSTKERSWRWRHHGWRGSLAKKKRRLFFRSEKKTRNPSMHFWWPPSKKNYTRISGLFELQKKKCEKLSPYFFEKSMFEVKITAKIYQTCDLLLVTFMFASIISYVVTMIFLTIFFNKR